MIIPLRGGLFWEQRPVVDTPDEYVGFAFGAGLVLGKEPRALLLDFSYTFTYGEDVLGALVPEQPELTTDVYEHQLVMSFIKHI